MDLIDFTNAETIINKYGGADNKITIKYNNKLYLLKKPSIAKYNKEGLNVKLNSTPFCKVKFYSL